MRLIQEKTKIDFLSESRRNNALGISFALIAISIASLATRGLDFGIDFTGGVLLEVSYSEAANLEGIRARLSDAGYAEYRVTRFGPDTDVQVRLPPQVGVESDAIRDSLRGILAADDPDVDLRRVEFVSAHVGDELTNKGGLAMIFVLLLIFFYIMLRFQWKFAAGAVAALVHDVILTIGFFSIFGISFDLTVVAAVLAVIGYSLNDTVVAFDRIRENFIKLRGTTPAHLHPDLQAAGFLYIVAQNITHMISVVKGFIMCTLLEFFLTDHIEYGLGLPMTHGCSEENGLLVILLQKRLNETLKC